MTTITAFSTDIDACVVRLLASSQWTFKWVLWLCAAPHPGREQAPPLSHTIERL